MLLMLTLAGAALLVLAVACGLTAFLRPRRIDDHPLCRRCGYDLSGRPADADRCPECGADTAAPRAVRLGNRTPRRGLIAACTLAAAVGLLVGGGGAAVLLSGVDLVPYQPADWLRRDALSADTKARDRAMAELNRRLAAGLLAGPQIDAVADAFLDRQADPKGAWAPAYGDWIEAADAAGKLGRPRLARYLEQAVSITISTRPRLLRGERMALRIQFDSARCGSARRWWAGDVSWDFTVNGKPLADPHIATTGFPLMRSGPPLTLRGPALGEGLPDGPLDVRVAVAGDVRVDTPKRASTAPALARFTRELRMALDLTSKPADVAVAFDRRHELRGEMQRRIQPRDLVYRVGQRYAQMVIDFDAPPADLGYAVVLTVNGDRYDSTGYLAIPAGSAGYQEVVIDLNRLPRLGDRVDVTLRPDATVVRESPRKVTPFADPLQYPGVAVREAAE